MANLTFPGGQEVQIEFDPTAHSYVVAHKLADGQFSDFRPTHGVTTPLVVVPKPFLKNWYTKLFVLNTLEYVAEHPALIDILPQFMIDTELYYSKAKNEAGKTAMTNYRYNKTYPWLKELKKAADKASGEGQDLGTWLHEAIENYYLSGRKTLPIITPDCQGMWDSFIQFDEFFEPRLETKEADRRKQCEFFVYSLMFGYSGQGDWQGYINGKYCILDWKSTNRSSSNQDGIDVSYFFQLGGLAQAEYERTGHWVEDLAAVNFDKKGGEPRIIFASQFGMSPQDAARAYVSCFNNYHMIQAWTYKFMQR